MIEYLWPPHVAIAKADPTLKDLSSRFSSPFTGTAYAYSRPGGDLIQLALEMQEMPIAERAAIAALIASLRGGVNRVWCREPGNVRRGTFPAAELLPNNGFASGVTGWSKSPDYVHSSADRVLRATRIVSDGSNNHLAYPTAAPTVVQYAPYVARYFARAGRGDFVDGLTVYDITSGARIGTTSTAFGLLTGTLVPSSTSLQPALLDEATTSVSRLAGEYLDILWSSLSRCALVDNAPNLLLYSDQFDNAAWTKTRASIVANGPTAPDGTSTADRLVEDSTASSTHFVAESATVGSGAADYAFSVSLKAGTRTWAALQLSETTGGTACAVYINLSTGALASTSTGANWSNLRAFVVNEGNGWYRITLVARKTNAATSVDGRIYLATGDGAVSYTGGGTSDIYLWRASLAQSSVPVRGAQTTSAATSGTAQSGSGLYLKGLPASASGLLLQADQVQSGDELLHVVASLDSDAAGLGYLQLHRPLRTPAADNAPIIVHEPMGLFMLAEQENGWQNLPGGRGAASAVLIEAPR